MRPDETHSYVVVQGTPSPMEVEAQQVVDAGLAWPGVALALVTALGGGAVGHWFASRAALKKASTDHTQLVLTTYSKQLEDFSVRLDRVETRLRRAEHGRDRYRRLAYQALDRVDDLTVYITRREDSRKQHDPDGTMTSWVPDPPRHLRDDQWTDRRREELSALDDLFDDEDDDTTIDEQTDG